MMSGIRILLFIVDLFVALTAIGGGVALVFGLETSDRVPPAWLEGTLFSNYIIPGLILAVVVGGSAAIATYATYDSRSAGGVVSILAGILMMGYIIVEVVILNQPSPWTRTEVFFFGIGLVMALLGVVIWRV